VSGHVLAIDLFEQGSTAASLAGKQRAEDTQQGLVVHEHIPHIQVSERATRSERSRQVVSSLVQDIQHYVHEHGTVDVLRLEGHGMSGHMFYKDIPIPVVEVAHALEQVQKQTGQKIAKKIEFSGCNTFSHLVDTLRKASVNLGSELVGTTDIEAMNYRRVVSFKHGEVGSFTPDTYSVISGVLVDAQKLMHPELSSSGTAKWAQCHAGKTQEDGAMCQLDMQPLKEYLKAKSVLPRYVEESQASEGERGGLQSFLRGLVTPSEHNMRR